MSRIRKALVFLVSLGAVAGAAYGVSSALHSPLFLVRVVEVSDQPSIEGEPPLSAQALTDLADVPIGKASLVELDLSGIEKRILSNPWVREVQLSKRFPQTLAISAVFRRPVALVRRKDGSLSYVDEDGTAFSRADLARRPDLPVLTGFPLPEAGDGRAPASADPLVQDALRLLASWERSSLGRSSQVSTLSWDRERGFRILATYPLQLQGKAAEGKPLGRSMIDLGQEIDAQIEPQLERLAHVINYLGRNNISARQIFADAGKKIVVKTARGS
jgi:hypothetical protein